MLLKNCIEGMQQHEDIDEATKVLTGRCIIPNLQLVLEDSVSYLPNLKKLELLKVLNMANKLVSSILEETNIRVSEENL